MSSHYETNRTLAERCAKLCCEKLHAASVIPTHGIFKPYNICFDFRGSKNEAHFLIEYQSGDLRQLRLMMVRPGSDMVVSHYMKKGTNQELIDYLTDAGSIPEFLTSFQQLSDSVDDKHD